MEDILIDTNVVIEYLRAKEKSKTLLIELMQEHRVSMASITEFELFLGAKTASHKKDIEMIFNEVQFMSFDFGCGEIAADIWNKLKESHQLCEIRDIFIASIAIYNDVWLCTHDKKHYKGIKGLVIWKHSL